VEVKSSTSNEPSEDLAKAKEEADKLRLSLQELQGKSQLDIEQAKKAADEKVAKTHFELMVNSFKDKIDGDTDEAKLAQLDFLKYQFSQNYSINVDGDDILVVDKDGNPVNNEDYSRKSLSDVVTENANKYLKLVVPDVHKGRGKDDKSNQQPANSKINWSKYGNDYGAYIKGKGIKPGTQEAMEAYIDYKDNAG